MATLTRRASASTIRFDAMVRRVDETTLLQLPHEASRKLRSRGQVAAKGTIDRGSFDTVLEPDGRGGHWMRIDDRLKRAARLGAGATATVELEPLTARRIEHVAAETLLHLPSGGSSDSAMLRLRHVIRVGCQVSQALDMTRLMGLVARERLAR